MPSVDRPAAATLVCLSRRSPTSLSGLTSAPLLLPLLPSPPRSLRLSVHAHVDHVWLVGMPHAPQAADPGVKFRPPPPPGPPYSNSFGAL